MTGSTQKIISQLSNIGVNFLIKLVPLTNAALSVWCGLVTGVTGALVGSRHVDALAMLAQVVT